MAGVKGRSGRKPFVKERTMEELLQCCAEYLHRIMTNPEETDANKREIAKALIGKYTPSSQTIEHEGLDQSVRAITFVHNYDGRQIDAVPEQQAESCIPDAEQTGS